VIDAGKEKPQESCGFSFWNGSPIYSICRKFEIRGKRRLHKRPDSHEIERCKWWSDIERRRVKPERIVALGATAARSLIGKTIIIQKLRGELAQPGCRSKTDRHGTSIVIAEDSRSR
jgi:uracil-DNA glycosylase